MVPNRLIETPIRAVEALVSKLTSPALKTYLVLDQVRIESALQQVFELGGHEDVTFLYQDTFLENLRDSSPLLIRINVDPNAPLLKRWLDDPLWQSSGCILHTQADSETLLRHLRSILHVQPPSGLPKLFRFYSPSVLEHWIPLLDEHQHDDFLNAVLAISWVAPQAPNPFARLHTTKRLNPGKASPTATSTGFKVSDEILNAFRSAFHEARSAS